MCESENIVLDWKKYLKEKDVVWKEEKENEKKMFFCIYEIRLS